MIVMFRAYRDEHAHVVSEEGVTLAVPISLVAEAGLRSLRTGQRLVLECAEDGSLLSVRLP